MLSKDNIELVFYKVYKRLIDVKQFETWLYGVDEESFERYFSKELYLNLLYLNYREKYVLGDLDKLIYSRIPFGKYEEENIKQLLNAILNKSLDLAEILEKMYYMYCSGYSFLRYIGLAYVCNGIDTVPRMTTKVDWLNEEEFKRRRSPLGSIECKISLEAERILFFLQSGKIEIIGENEYRDLRDDAEKTELYTYETMYVD